MRVVYKHIKNNKYFQNISVTVAVRKTAKSETKTTTTKQNQTNTRRPGKTKEHIIYL